MHTLRCIHPHIIKSRCLFILLYNYNLNSFEPFCITGCSRWLTILRPAKPAVRLCMHTIIYIVLVLICTGQLNLDCFESLCFSSCSIHLAICRPRKPAICLTVCRILDSKVFIATDRNFDTFETLGFPGCSTHHTIRYRILPSKGLNVGAVRGGNFPLYIFKCIAICYCISFCI